MSESPLEFTRRYFQAIEAGAPPEELAGFFHPEVRQREYPNRLTPRGATRDLQALLDASARGSKVVVSQRYDVRSALCDGERVALEVDWSATLAVPVGSLPAGGTMRASLGVFLTFRDGRIATQHNYDCFEPF
ncbi:nuclear transport factor 2 family protein [Corallococcus praedator]|uniref:Nuclear transport factor 2 family protein n=1 Tax=Corallococcus praedator TaxID=2316724 RepID=A0ABX9QL71_9BACT|nr:MULTISPECIES: nuclear transport factor 2 family protein [Corallococcus]RKH33309.1 nuclear transport factor 2 family protein [Corallococcus sp. CA031C]RKI12264.1 nuclear transport factor 2 family protein [Corallococcus praedator]